MKLALAMIVKSSDDEAIILDRCLHYASGAVDGIFITITHAKGQKPNLNVYDICNKYAAITSDFEWINDFAAARNFNFSQVPDDYTHILWLDADDVLKDSDTKVGMGSNLKTTIEAHPEVDAFSMFYLYAFDEHENPVVVHQKTRVVKNDKCCTWSGLGIHEELVPNRQLNTFAIKGIDVVHRSTEERLGNSRVRNYIIALLWSKNHPQDPTVYFNLANASFGVQKYEDSLNAFAKFLTLSKSDDEKYLARLRRADVFWARGQFEAALDEARYAIGMKSEYPDAFHAAGKFYYALNRFEDAKNMFLNGLGRPAPVFQIIVYNPREYDYQPLMNLAKTYYALNLPQLALPCLEAAIKIVPADEALKKTIKILKKEAIEGDEVVKLCGKLRKITDLKKLKKELDKIPAKFKFHPEVLRIRNTNFVKTESSGRDLVIFCGFTQEEWTPESIAKKGSGGSEEAAITMAQGLANKGWNVTVYNNCGNEEQVFNDANSSPVTYKPYMSWNYRDKQDVTILWRNTKPLDWEINSTHVFVDMHDVIPSGEFSSDRIRRLDKVFFKSQYHRKLYPQIPDEKTIVIPNGIWPEAFKLTTKDPYLMINTASPVRSLTALIDIMKEVRKEVPQAKMQWAYGWSVTDGGMSGESDYPAWKAKVLDGMKEAGIEDLGRLTHKQVAELYNKASYYIYPTGFPEIDCISITKALAADCLPISTDYAAIGEKTQYGGEYIHWTKSHNDLKTWDMSVDDEAVKKQFVKTIVKHLKHPQASMANEGAKANYAWPSIIEKWNETIQHL